MTYVKHRHPASGYAVVGIAVVVGSNGARVTITGATSKPERLAGVEAVIASGINESSIEQAVSRASEGVYINGDLYADEQYRSHLIGQLVRKALQEVAG
jgi:carbon-monoxide dehydrogenase medium subunit